MKSGRAGGLFPRLLVLGVLAFLLFSGFMPVQSASPTREFKDMAGMTHSNPGAETNEEISLSVLPLRHGRGCRSESAAGSSVVDAVI